jgi:hypothetical protein
VNVAHENIKNANYTLPDEDEHFWDPIANPEVTRLLDHLAEELAMEYVRLMEKAAEEGSKNR